MPEMEEAVPPAMPNAPSSDDRASLPQHPNHIAPSISLNSGWLSHVPVVHPDQFPRAPASFLYDTSPAGDQPSSSTATNRYLLNHHPAYGSPENFDSSNGNHSTSVAPLSEDFASLAYVSGSTVLSSPGGRAFYHHNSVYSEAPRSGLGPSLAGPQHLPQDRYGPGRSSDLETYSGNISGTSQLPLAPQHVQYGLDQLPPDNLIDPALYEVDQAPHGSYLDDEDDDLEDEVTDAEDVPGSNWPGRNQKRSMEGLLHDDKAPQPNKRPRKKAERPRGRKKGEIRGPRTTLEPGEDFMKVYNDAMDAFIEDNDIQRAQRLVLEAIGKNPEIFAAHSLLADIHFAREDPDSATDALMMGLHAHVNDIELWRQVADTILSNKSENHQKRIERAMYCYNGILRKSAKDLDARFQRAECARLLGSWNRAFSDLNILLHDDPHNSAVLAQFARLCQSVGDVAKAKAVYDDHFDYYKTNGLSEEQHFTWQDIGVYVELMMQLGETAQAILMLKRLTRWLCGREHETFWEEFLEDDRELDQNHYPRRLKVARFMPSAYPEQNYGEALPLDLRGKLGVMRLKLNFRAEAQSHFNWLEPDLEGEESIVEEYCDTFYEIAKALHDAKEHEQALHFFDALHKEDLNHDLQFFMDMGASCYICGQRERAVDLYLRALELDPPNIETRTQLTRLYKDLGNREQALKYGNEAVVMAQSRMPVNTNRKYERRENRLAREAAENALKNAYKIPKGPGQRPGKVPQGLKYKRRATHRQFVKWIPRYDTPEGISPTHLEDDSTQDVSEAFRLRNLTRDGSLDPEGGYHNLNEAPSNDRHVKATKRAGRPHKAKAAPRKVLNQENAIKHYEEVRQLYRTLLNHQDAMREGDEISTNVWMDCATALVDDFRTVKVFFPGERHKKFEGYTFITPRPRPSTPTARNNQASPTSEEHSIHAISSSYLNNFQSASLPDTGGSESSARRIAPEGIPDEYCDIPFLSWLDIFLELALLQAQSGSSDSQVECYNLINAVIDCTVFYHDQISMITTYVCYLACCLALGDDTTLFNTVVRWFMREFAFCTDTYRMYASIALVNELSANPSQADAAWKSSPNQKFIFRQIMSIDKCLPDDYNKDGVEGGVPAFMRRHREELRKLSNKVDVVRINDGGDDGGDRRDRESPPGAPGERQHTQATTAVKVYKPVEMDIVLFILYAHIMMASGSFPNALSYLYRAYSLDQTNTVCLLSMALCYLHELSKRQTSNRHSYALLGWAWFGRYESERIKWAREIDQKTRQARHHEDESSSSLSMEQLVTQEIEFNKARLWEMLGMADLGMRGYKKVLDLAVTDPGRQNDEYDDDNDDDNDDGEEAIQESWTMEAAYAMSVLYSLNGNGSKAREITEKYLVVE